MPNVRGSSSNTRSGTGRSSSESKSKSKDQSRISSGSGGGFSSTGRPSFGRGSPSPGNIGRNGLGSQIGGLLGGANLSRNVRGASIAPRSQFQRDMQDALGDSPIQRAAQTPRVSFSSLPRGQSKPIQDRLTSGPNPATYTDPRGPEQPTRHAIRGGNGIMAYGNTTLDNARKTITDRITPSSMDVASAVPGIGRPSYGRGNATPGAMITGSGYGLPGGGYGTPTPAGSVADAFGAPSYGRGKTLGSGLVRPSNAPEVQQVADSANTDQYPRATPGMPNVPQSGGFSWGGIANVPGRIASGVSNVAGGIKDYMGGVDRFMGGLGFSAPQTNPYAGQGQFEPKTAYQQAQATQAQQPAPTQPVAAQPKPSTAMGFTPPPWAYPQYTLYGKSPWPFA